MHIFYIHLKKYFYNYNLHVVKLYGFLEIVSYKVSDVYFRES